MEHNNVNKIPIQGSVHGYNNAHAALTGPMFLRHPASSFSRPPAYFYPPYTPLVSSIYQPYAPWMTSPFDDIRRVGTNPVGKHKRNRTNFSKQQLAVLEQAFAETQYPDLENREYLAGKIGLPEPKILVWFQNRRTKQRKLQKETNKGFPLPEKCKDIIGSTTAQFEHKETATTSKTASSHSESQMDITPQELGSKEISSGSATGSRIPQEVKHDSSFSTSTVDSLEMKNKHIKLVVERSKEISSGSATGSRIRQEVKHDSSFSTSTVDGLEMKNKHIKLVVENHC